MDAVISFFRNKWTKLAFSVLSLGYGAFVVWMAWLLLSFYLVPTNAVSLFSLYLLINVMFGVIMVYTRKQIITQIVACFLHPCILLMLVFAFGNWFLLIPPFAVATVVFFAAGSPESLKTVLGTIYLILFFLTTLGYLTLQRFSINLFPVDMALRCPREDYLYSTGETYRLVTYIDRESKEDRNIRYYVELAGDDLSLPFLECEMYINGKHILTQRLANRTQVEWLTDSKLLIDGKVKDVSVDAAETDSPEEDDFSGETAIFTLPPEMTTAATSPPEVSAVNE